MSGCGCSGVSTPFCGQTKAYRRVLLAIIAINASMFLVELMSGYLARSQALTADALDFLGDAATYSLSLAVIGLSLRARATAALIKGATLAVVGVVVLATTAQRVFLGGLPHAETMTAVGLLALAANLTSVLLLLRYRSGDANVRSVWLCSRNDALGNIAVIGAGAAVAATASPWPDLIVAALIATLFLTSALQIVRQSVAELRSTAPTTTAAAAE